MPILQKMDISKQMKKNVFIVDLKNMEVLLVMNVAMKKMKIRKKLGILHAKIVFHILNT